MSDDKPTYRKKTCALCPFSRSKTLWLHPERADELASMASNPYTDFPCHKTADLVEDNGIDDNHGYVHGDHSLTCAGFLTLQVNENGCGPKGFKPDPDGFDDWFEMIEHHEEHWSKTA